MILFALLLIPFRLVEGVVSILLILVPIAMMLSIGALFHTSGQSILSWFIVIAGLPLVIVLFKAQYDSDIAAMGMHDRLVVMYKNARGKP